MITDKIIQCNLPNTLLRNIVGMLNLKLWYMKEIGGFLLQEIQD